MKPMTKQRVGQYQSLKREIDMLEDRIYKAENSGDFVTDMVRGSMKGPPYAMHNITIQGYGSKDVPKLAARKARCISECDAIEKFIDGLEDSTMRQLLTLRYIEGRSMEETAELIGYSKNHVWRRISIFFNQNDDGG